MSVFCPEHHYSVNVEYFARQQYLIQKNNKPTCGGLLTSEPVSICAPRGLSLVTNWPCVGRSYLICTRLFKVRLEYYFSARFEHTMFRGTLYINFFIFVLYLCGKSGSLTWSCNTTPVASQLSATVSAKHGININVLVHFNWNDRVIYEDCAALLRTFLTNLSPNKRKSADITFE